jgi:hypothetical protein
MGIEQLFGGVIDHGEEGKPLVGVRRQRAVATAIEMEELAETGPRGTPTAMTAARAALGHQPRSLQGLLDEGVAEAHPVLAPRSLA